MTVQKNWLLSIPTWDYFVITDYHLVFSSALAIFERCMENLLQDMNGVCVYFDDILVTGSSSEGHLQNLDKVLTKIDEAGLRRNRSKCSFMMSKIEYLGHVIDEHGFHPTEDNVKAIQEAPRP